MKLSTVLFDLDGTLVDSLRDLHQGVNHILAQYGRPPLAEEVVRGYIGDGVRVLLSRSFLDWRERLPAAGFQDGEAGEISWQEIENRRRVAIESLLRQAKAMHHPSLDEAVMAFRAYYAEHLTDFSKLYAGVEETLKELSGRGIALGVVSNKPQHHSDKILADLKVKEYFQVVVGGDTLPVTKPDPAPILFAISKSGAHPETALMVGDSGNDIVAGRNAGCKTAAVAYGFNDLTLLKKYQPDWLIQDCRELLARSELR